MITLTITTVDNIDYDASKVKDESQIMKKEFEWDEPIRILDVVYKKETNEIVNRVSLFDHRLILDGKQHHILHLLSVG